MNDPLYLIKSQTVYVENTRTAKTDAENIAKILATKLKSSISTVLYRIEPVKIPKEDQKLYKNKQCFEISFFRFRRSNDK